MKLHLLFIFLFISSTLFSQDKNEKTIQTILKEQTGAWNRGDIDGFMQGYWNNDSLLFVGKSGVTYGWQNTLNNYKKRYPDVVAMGKLHFNILTIKKLSKKYYSVLGQWQLTRSIGNLEGYYTLLFKKINGNWMIVCDHTS